MISFLAPWYGQPCTTICQKPFECIVAPEVHVTVPPFQMGTTGLPIAEQTGTFCLCRPPYEYNSGTCMLSE